MPLITRNTLFYGDNLPILRDYIDDASVDLVYLDPPFNSNRSYNVLFKDESGRESEAQITAFDDTWHWGPDVEKLYQDLVLHGDPQVGAMMSALRGFLGTNQMMAYLVNMAARLAELHRVLKPTGSLYLHCDSTASHYLKIVLDAVFGPRNFRGEIVWKRYSSHNDARRTFAAVTDNILFYGKSGATTFNIQYTGYDESYINDFFRYTDEQGRRYRVNNLASPNPRPNLTYEYKGYPPPPNGWKVSREKMEELDRQGRIHYPRDPKGRLGLRYYLADMLGVIVGNLWDDIQSLSGAHGERMGYPTQKPVALLERIIVASSNPSDVVLDPFCGCGTTIAAAQQLGRRWIGIDITHLSISLMKNRLKDAFNLEPKRDYDVKGEPEDLAAARQLAQDDRYQFQWWALSLVEARPVGGEGREGKKGADQGVDGVILFMDDNTGKAKRAAVQVKSGHVKSGDIRDLRGVLERDEAALALFITLEHPSKDMLAEAAAAGVYHSPGWNRDYPRLQILTVADLLNGAEPKMPPAAVTYKQAAKSAAADAGQDSLFGG